MSDFYRLESDPTILINLEASREIIQEQQARLHRVAAKLIRDIDVLTNVIVEGVE